MIQAAQVSAEVEKILPRYSIGEPCLGSLRTFPRISVLLFA
jgi:hypothetical protein